MKKYFALLSISLFFGCASGLNREAASIRIVRESSFVKQCKFLASVESTSYWGGYAATGVGYQSAMNQLKNKASEVEANTLLLVTLENSMGGTNMSGDAYRCPQN